MKDVCLIVMKYEICMSYRVMEHEMCMSYSYEVCMKTNSAFQPYQFNRVDQWI